MPKTDVRRSSRELPRAKRKPKKLEEDTEDEEESEFEALPRWKLCLIGAIVFLCFALLYPSVFGPIINSLLGRSQPQATTTQNMPPVHPALNRQPGVSQTPARPHMHPAASARMPHVESQQQTGRGGMFTWMLPIYTIGVMVFLCYTLFKIMFKKKKNKSRRGKYAYSSEEEESGEDEATGMNRKRLRSLQSRLQETESAMSKILEQLETLAQSSNNDQATPSSNISPQPRAEEQKSDQVDKMSPEQLQNIEESMKKLTELSKLYKKQKAQLEASEDEQDEESSEEEERDIEEEMDDVEVPIQEDKSTDDEGISENESQEERETEEERIEDSPKTNEKQVRRRQRRE